MPTVVDLGALDSQGFVITGELSGDYAGWTVSDAGDVNGDGLDDLIIGTSANLAYVVFGQTGGPGNIDLGDLSTGDGFVITGSYGDVTGFYVSAAGDVNGDGFDDIIVGGLQFSYYYYGLTPTAYVIFGKEEGVGTVNVSQLAASDGFQIQGGIINYYFGALVVSSAGDVNGDGFDDVIVGSQGVNDRDGAAYVIFGKASGFGPIDLLNLSTDDGFVIAGHAEFYDYAGWSVSGAGDINGDGFDDLIVGAPNGWDGGIYSGQAYVIFGKANGFATIDLGNLQSAAGFEIVGDAYEGAGISVSGAGDVNGDGFDDLIVGAPFGSDGGTYSGQVYVIFGKASGFGTIDLSNLAASAGFVIVGDAGYDHAGWSVSAAGDVNGDGFADIIVGAPDNDQTRNGVSVNGGGEAYLIFGKASGFGTIDLTNLSSADGFIIQGDNAYDFAGVCVSAAGDVNGDGFDDLLVGAPYNDGGGYSSGAAYIIFGDGPLDQLFDVRNDFNSDGRSDVLWRSDTGQFSDWLGQLNGGFVVNDTNAFRNVPTNWQIAGTGDFDGDGNDDVLWRSDSGQVSDWLGTGRGGFLINDGVALTSVPTTWHVVGTGDFNGDERDDILWRSDTGQLSNWLGRSNGGFTVNDANAFAVVPTSWHVAATGDFNGDGRDDILWRSDSGQLSNWLGTATGGWLNNDANAFSGAPTSWHIAGTGDFNGDGRDDILWRSDSGQLSNWLATASGGFIVNDSHALASVPLAWQVVAIGDYNGDGRDDILWRSTSGQLSNWLGTASGGFTNNDANAFSAAPTSWHTEPDAILV